MTTVRPELVEGRVAGGTVWGMGFDARSPNGMGGGYAKADMEMPAGGEPPTGILPPQEIVAW